LSSLDEELWLSGRLLEDSFFLELLELLLCELVALEEEPATALNAAATIVLKPGTL
jgi:hypothetical protein